jgi:hypothetical protein
MHYLQCNLLGKTFWHTGQCSGSTLYFFLFRRGMGTMGGLLLVMLSLGIFRWMHGYHFKLECDCFLAYSYPLTIFFIFLSHLLWGAMLWAGWLEVLVLAGAGNFSLHHRVQTGSGAHPASYPMCTMGSLPRDEAARVWSLTFTCIYCQS